MERNPVLLVHGLYDTVAKFNRMSSYLSDLGWSVHCLNLIPNDGNSCLETLAQQVKNYIKNTFFPNQPIDLIGFSMGGIVTRYYLQRLGGIEKVQRYISISAPNNGTFAAYSLPYTGIQQMRPDSEFLRDLNQDRRDILGKIKLTILWTPFDLMIIPPQSSLIGIGREIQIPVLVHAWMVDDSRTLNIISKALSEPLD